MHWNRDLPQLYDIESSYPDPVFHPTPSLDSQNYGERSHRRSQRTGRSKLYRDQLTDVVTTLHQLSAKNRKVDPICPSPQSFYQPIKILQRPKEKSTVPLRQAPKSYFSKPLSQRQAEYAQHRARIFKYKLRPGIFHAHFFPP